MGTENFTLTISQSTTNANDFAVHLKEHGHRKKEKLLAHIRFSKAPYFDEVYMDEVVALVAQKLAQRIIDNHQANLMKQAEPTQAQLEASSKRVVDDILTKLQKKVE